MSTTPRPRATKIICTVGPATDSAEMLTDLIKAGANVFRLNMSHAAHDWVRKVVTRIRKAANELKTNVAVLFDLQGPSIRTGDLPEPYQLQQDDVMEIRLRTAEARLPYSTTVNYDGLLQDVQAGNTMVVDNGALLMRIEQVQSDRLICKVLTEGVFGSRRHINLPGVALRLPALTEKDLADLAVAVECETDYVAMSFVRDAAHVRQLRGKIDELGGNAQIVAKIEDQQAVRNIDDIILSADVIMVARGDLGIEVNVVELPGIQRRIIKHCHRLGRRCIVATHMLESMITQPTPTRAEVTDVSNAIFEQTDAVMLSGETSVGHYPVRCVEMLDSIAHRVEQSSHLNFAAEAILDGDRLKATKAAIELADSVENACLVVFTRRGLAATQAAMLRPERAPIYAFSYDPVIVRQLALARNVTAFECPFLKDPSRMISEAIKMLKAKKLVHSGQPIVIQGDNLQGELIADSIIFMRAE